jgi:succinate dehydrogenase (ubiquinone) iron-sulfur subunit
MQSLAAKASLVRVRSLQTASVRTFVSSAARWQAVPTEKPVLQKEFKIYRWVCPIYLFVAKEVLIIGIEES